MTTTSAPTSQAADYDEIVRVVQLYIDGFRTGHTTLFEEAFHDDAWIFFTEADGTLVKSATRDCYQEWAGTPNPDIVGRIITVTQAGDIANVLLGWDAPRPERRLVGRPSEPDPTRWSLEDHQHDRHPQQQGRRKLRDGIGAGWKGPAPHDGRITGHRRHAPECD